MVGTWALGLAVEVEVALTRVVGATVVGVGTTGVTAEASAGAEAELDGSTTELGTWTLLLGVLVTSTAAVVVDVWAADLVEVGGEEEDEAGAVTWLQAVHVRSPPGTGGPPLGAHPDVAVLGHVGEHAVDGSLAVAVDAAGELADEALLVVFLQPGGGGLETLLADGAADAGLGGSGAVTVQVLVHLVDNLVLGVREGLQVVVVVGPGPGAAPGVAFDEDVLAGGASGTDSVNGSLVKVQDEGLVKVVVLVV